MSWCVQSRLPTKHTIDVNVIVSPNSAFVFIAFPTYTVVQI